MKQILKIILLTATIGISSFLLPNMCSSATLTTVVTFDNTNGYLPQAGLVLGKDGNVYGTLSYGGWFNLGTLFRVSPDGRCVIVVTFDGENGSHPDGLLLGKDGIFYGSTLEGGPTGNGSVFRMTPDVVITTLATFSDGNGVGPIGLFQGPDGNLYGSVADIAGTARNAFRVTLNGQLIAPFTNTVPTNGGDLLRATDGNSYGTTFNTVYKISPDGTRTTLAVLRGTDNGGNPIGKLVQGRDGNLYGITTGGGAFNQGTVFRVNLNETPNAAPAGASQINVPVLLHAVSNEVDPRIMDAMQGPIDFYGKVVDENSNAVVGADVSFHWMDLLARGMENSATTKSDAQGLFSLRGKQGAGMSVTVSKEGYYASHRGQQFVEYSKMRSDRFVPDAKKPSIFHLRKKGEGAPLIQHDFPPGMGQHWQLHHDGAAIYLDLINGSQTIKGSGQLKLEFWRDISEKNARTFDWKLQMSISGGGLIQTEEEFPFEAPETGYQPSVVIDMPKTNKAWAENVRTIYYIKLSDGKYGRVNFDFSGYNGIFRVSSAINASGSRYLEPR